MQSPYQKNPPDAPAAESKLRGASTQTVDCAVCNTENSSTQTYCAKCGAHLFQPCLRCDADCAAIDAFCGRCGAANREVEQELISAARQRLQQAEECAARHEYRQAEAHLDGWTRQDHPCMQEVLELRNQMRRRIRQQEQQQRDRAAELATQAEQLLQQHAYVQAAEVARQIAEPLRDAAMRRILSDAETRAQRVLQLKQEIQKNSRQLAFNTLAMKIYELRVLDPNDAQVQKWHKQIDSRVASMARKHLQACQYEEAHTLLEQLAHASSDNKDLLVHAAEMRWLSLQLRIAPYADSTLLEIARRLHKASPVDQQASQAAKKVQSLLASANGRSDQRSWTRSPEQTRLGPRVDQLLQLPGIQIADSAREVVGKSPDSFAVACGLALQGLQQAQIGTNLIPRVKVGLWKRLQGTGRGESAWGIDIGENSLKAVRLVSSKDGPPTITAAWISPDRGIRPLTGTSRTKNTELIQQSVRQFREQFPRQSGDCICTNWPSAEVLVRYSTIPAVSERKLQSLIEYDVKRQIPFDIDDVVWQYHVRDPDGSTAINELMLVVAKRQPIERWLTLLAEADLQPDCIQAESLALHNFMHFAFLRGGTLKADKAVPAIAALDVGRSATRIVICSSRGPWFRTAAVGGDRINKALVPVFKLTDEQVEKLKRNPQAASRLSDLDVALQPVFERLVVEYERSIDSLSQTLGPHEIQRVVGLGGGFRTWGLLRFLRWGR